MSCKTPILRAVFDSPTVQDVDANGVVNLPEVTSNSCCASSTGGSISLRERGTYEVHVNGTVSIVASNPLVEIQLFRNGSPVPGAHAFVQSATAGDLVSFSFTALVTVECCGSETLTLRPDVDTSFRVANVTLEQVN